MIIMASKVRQIYNNKLQNLRYATVGRSNTALTPQKHTQNNNTTGKSFCAHLVVGCFMCKLFFFAIIFLIFNKRNI